MQKDSKQGKLVEQTTLRHGSVVVDVDVDVEVEVEVDVLVDVDVEIGVPAHWPE
jgi:hypothetical protein